MRLVKNCKCTKWYFRCTFWHFGIFYFFRLGYFGGYNREITVGARLL